MNSVPITLSSSNVLSVAGNAVVTTNNGSTNLGNIGFVGDAIYDFNGIVIENADLSHGATAAVIIPTNGSSDPVQINNTYGNIVLQAGVGAGLTAAWKFGNDGNLSLPAGNLAGLGNVIGPGNIAYPFGPGPVLLADNSANNSAYFSLTAVANADGVLGYVGIANFGGNSSTGLVETVDGTGNSYSWYFQNDGTTAFPSYTFPNVDGANGQALTTNGTGILSWSNVSGGNGNPFNQSLNTTDSVTFATVTTTGTGGDITTTGGNIGGANYITGNFFVGDGSGLSNISVTANTGNISFNNSTLVGPSFGVVPSANSSVYIQPTVDSANVFQFGADGNITASGNLGVVVNSNLWSFDTNGALTFPGNTLQIGLIAGNTGLVSQNAANITIDTTSGGGNTWIFGTDGELYLPTGGRLGVAGKNWTGLDGGNGNPVSLTSLYSSGMYSACLTAGIDGSLSISTYGDGTGLTGNWIFDIAGNLSAAGNIIATGTVSAIGNITANYFIGNGSQLTGLPATYGNSNVATLLSAFGSNAISTTGTITVGNTFTNGNAQIGTALQIIGSTNTLQTTNGSAIQFANRVNFNAAGSSIVASGNISGANILGSTLSVSGNVTGNYILGNAALMTGIPASYGNANLANIGANSISTTGNISAGYLFGNASQLTGLPASYGNANVAAYLPIYSGNLNAGNIISSGNANINLDPGGTGIVAIIGSASATGNIVTAGNFVGNGAALTNVTVSVAGNIVGTQPNVSLVAGSYTWTFDNTGNVTLPAGGDINMTSASSSINVGGTVNSYGNTNGTAFAVIGNGAQSNVALGFFPTGNTPAQMAIRDYSTANSYMYFDATAGSANTGGTFAFRSSNAYTVLATINTYGVSQPTKPGFRVYGNGVTGGLNVTTNGNGVLNGNNWAVDYNQGSYLNSTTGVFVAPVAGLYQVNLVARVANNTAGASQAVVIKNAGTTPVNQVFWEVAANCTTNHFGVGTVSKLAVGDTLTLKITQGNVTFDANDNWSVAFLG